MTDLDDESLQEPRIVALAWVKFAIGQGRLDLAWAITEPIGRLCIAQDWVHRNWSLLRPTVSDRDTVIDDLASETPSGQWARDFLEERGAYFERTYADVEVDHLVAGQRDRLLAPDMEVVLLIDERDLGEDDEGEPAWMPDTHVRSLPIAMRLVGRRWLVHSPGVVLQPGWPPTVIEDLTLN